MGDDAFVADLTTAVQSDKCFFYPKDNLSGGGSICYPVIRKDANVPEVLILTSSKELLRFTVSTSGYVAAAGRGEQLSRIGDGSGGSYWVLSTREGSWQIFDSQGRLLSNVFPDGWRINFGRTGLAWTGMSDPFGRTISIDVDNQKRVKSLVTPNGYSISYAYQDDALQSVTHEDGGVTNYIYNESQYATGVVDRKLMTGIVDESTRRYSTFKYNSSAQAISTEHGVGVDKYSFNIQSDIYTETTDPLGTKYVQYWRKDPEKGFQLKSKNQPAGAGCDAATKTNAFDSAGFLLASTDFNQRQTCFVYDQSRNLETTRVEGLSNTATCGNVTGAGATLPAGSRKVSTAWHPDWRLQTQQAEPLKLTTWVYNGQPDPSSGNATASCAPSSAVLPDGKPIAVLCKTIEQATTDADGHSGLSATLDTTVASRVTSATYNQYGQVLTRVDANGHTTTYTYYSDTSFTGSDPNAVGHTMGDLQSVANALGQATTFTLYDKAGHVLSMTDPNGLVTTYSYAPRGWITSISRGGETTSYDYWPTGLLKKATLPSQASLSYTYDDAHRLTDITDNLGNTVHYTLDNAGNRTNEAVKDASGTLTRNIDRTYDALNRLQKVTGALQ